MTNVNNQNGNQRPHYRLPLTANHLRIGLVGGSFNPAHEGHRRISLYALKKANLDRIWWLVSPGNPTKSHHNLAPLESRIETAKEIAAHPHIDVTAFEATLPTNYTADTLRFLQKRRPNISFVWIMGADNLATFHHWQNWQQIMQSMPVLVFNRPKYALKALASKAAHRFRKNQLRPEFAARIAQYHPPAWSFLQMPLSSLSSTKIRSRAN